MSKVEDAWSRIVAWSKANNPEAVADLRPGATADAIAAAESAIGVQFPDDLKTLYRLADGSEVDYPGQLDDGHWFMPLAQAIELYEIMIEFADEQPVDDYNFWRSQVDNQIISVKGPVKPHSFSKRWIPLTNSNGDVHRCIDLDPAPGGSPGQVIEVYPEACSHQVLADSLGDYLAKFAERLETGRFVMEHGSLVDPDSEEVSDWGVPDYMLMGNVTEPLAEPGPGEIELTGDMGMVAGTGNEIYFTLHLDDGREPAFLASREGTKGYNTIAVRQRATVRAVHFDKSRPTTFEAPDYEVLEYRMIRE